MLSLHLVTPRQGRHYYKEENYYSQDQAKENSEWFGAGAQGLGLKGRVDPKAFEKLLYGHHPDSGLDLIRRSRIQKRQQRSGIDLTFSAPKSVSLAVLVGGDSRLEDAHKKAVAKALQVAEERYSLYRSSGERYEVVAGNLVVAQFHHDSSRAKDPQLHTHCVVLNGVKTSGGGWRGLRNEGFYRHSKLLGLVYQNELALRVQRLGYDIEVNARGTFEIKGYSEEQLKAFSKRRVQLTEELGVTSQKEARSKVKINRPAKGAEIPREILQAQWEKEGKALHLKHPRVGYGMIQYVDCEKVTEKAMAHAGERDVRFRQEDMERFVLENHLGKVFWPRLQEEIEREKGINLLPTKDQKWTTRQALMTEEKILEYLKEGQGKVHALFGKIPQDLESKGFTNGQKEALKKSLLTKDQFTAWQGVAGAGKTFALKELREKAETRGVKVYGFAPSAEAAKVLEHEALIQSQTVAHLIKGGGGERGLWIVDEAGLLSARDCERLMSKAREVEAKVIFVGDTRQLSSVEAGNPFKLMQDHGIETSYLTESRRQKTQALKKAAESMARGEMVEGLQQIESLIKEFSREETRVAHVAKDFLSLSAEEQKKTLVLAGTNRERRLITEKIRDGLKSQGLLGDEVRINSLVPKDLTKEEIKAGAKIEVGDVLVFHRRDQGFSRGDHFHVKEHRGHALVGDSKELSLLGQDSFTVYQAKEMKFAEGDRVRWTRNDQGLRNGEEFFVGSIQGKDLRLRRKDGSEVDIKGPLFLDHSYVSTVYASQGKTAERVIVSADHTFGREAMYVSVTRAKSEVTIYTEDKGKMMGRAEVSRAKESARFVISDGSKFREFDRIRVAGKNLAY